MWTAFFSTPVTCTSPGTFGTASSHDIYHYKKALSFSILKLIRKGEFLIMNKKQLLIRSGNAALAAVLGLSPVTSMIQPLVVQAEETASTVETRTAADRTLEMLAVTMMSTWLTNWVLQSILHSMLQLPCWILKKGSSQRLSDLLTTGPMYMAKTPMIRHGCGETGLVEISICQLQPGWQTMGLTCRNLSR